MPPQLKLSEPPATDAPNEFPVADREFFTYLLTIPPASSSCFAEEVPFWLCQSTSILTPERQAFLLQGGCSGRIPNPKGPT